jgi:hypothetical protein
MLIVEDGSGNPIIPFANSYLSVDYADEYHALVGNSDWASNTTADKEEALINATQSIDLLYGQRFKSFPITFNTNLNQQLLWPRMLVQINRVQIIPSKTIPFQLMRATAECAMKYLNGDDIFPMAKIDNVIRSKDLEISGGLKKSVSYAQLPFTEDYPGFNKISLLLKPLLLSTANPGYLSL